MKNVTITLDDKQAAEQNTSVSRFVGEMLQKQMRRAQEYERARRLFFSSPP